ncbi:MAG: hypothetical protein IPL65_01470 [Lewinellaceae bacterium]|nr:hypothetical protein [Lewinellaceae bacterium]
MSKHFQRALRATRKAWEEQPFRHADYFTARAAIEYEEYQFLSSGSRTEALNLQALMDATDLSFMVGKLRQACFAITHQAVYKATYQFGLFDAMLGYLLENPALLEEPAVALYYYCYQFLTEPEEELHFTRFKSRLFQDASRLPTDEQRDLHLLAINYCIRKINQLRQGYFREALDLYQSALRAELLLENGLLSHFAFNNIVAIALKVGETDWAASFVRSHAQYLEKNHREANVQLNLARVAYVQMHYKDALLHLQEADYKDLINNLIAKTLQMKIYYETAELDVLDAQLQSMQSFLRRRRVIGYHRDNFQNIIRMTRKLMLLNWSDRKEKEALQVEIESLNPLTEKEWLLEKLH